MIDLSIATSGKFGEGTRFSDLFYAAVRTRFTGGVLVQSGEVSRTVFFKNGAPVHAGGAGFAGHYLGQILVKEKKCPQGAVDAALAEQQGRDTVLLGTLLVASAGIAPEDVQRAVRTQTAQRVTEVMHVEDATYQAAPGEDPRIRTLGVAVEGWPTFFAALERGATDAELRTLSNDLLGQAVRANAKRLPQDFTPTEQQARLLHYLEKPRKPDQLERALKDRRFVRGFLRGLDMFGVLERVPAKQGIPIPKATLLKGQMGYAAPEPTPRAATPRPATPVPKANTNHPIVKEVEALHAKMKNLNHFELIGATDKTEPSQLRSLFTTLVKQYHPDAFPHDAPETSKVKAREVCAALNDAYQTLTDDEARAHYIALLADDRIKGDARKAELIREAEMKSQMGVVMLKKREYQKAREFFKFAMEADDSSGAYRAFFAWAMFGDPKFDRKEALEKAYPLLLEALKRAPNDVNVHYYLAQVLKAKDKPTEAMHHFKEALRADPQHTDAVRELRLLKLRKDKEKAGGKERSALSKLFKRS